MQNLGGNRTWIDIYAEILGFTVQPKGKTRIMYYANLSYKRLQIYLNGLINLGLLKKIEENPRTKFKTTERGERFLEVYIDLRELL